MSGADGKPPPPPTRTLDLVAALALATDLALGQPMEHVWRATLLATRLAEEVGVDDDVRDATFWMSLLALSGCTADSYELTQYFGDDIELRRGMYEAGPSSLAQLRYFVSRAGSDGGPVRRLRVGARLIATGMRPVLTSLHSHCAVTAEFATQLGLGGAVVAALGHTFARWDGKGVPAGVAREQMALPARLLALADAAEYNARTHGAQAAVSLAQAQSGNVLDPGLVNSWSAAAPRLLSGLPPGDQSSWEQLLDASPPEGVRPLSPRELDTACTLLADYADLKSPAFTGHSRFVAELSVAAARHAGLTANEIVELRRAALLHELGRAGVPNTLWDRTTQLTLAERERVRSHVYLTERILASVPGLAPLADLAAASHERLDGSGYPRRISGAGLSRSARLLAAADKYRGLIEEHPNRHATSADEAAQQLHRDARAGLLDAEMVTSVLAVAGHRPATPAMPAGLTARELEVLTMVCRGRTSKQVASALGISAKTVNNHIERAYTKVGVGSRAAATLYLAKRGLV